MKMPSFMSSLASRSSILKNIENKVGARIHPCLTPFEMGKVSESAPANLTCPS